MKLGPKFPLLVAAVLLYATVTFTGSANAQLASRERGVPMQHDGAPSRTALAKHVLKGTYFDTSSSVAAASCDSAGCSAFAPIFSEGIVCPVPAGKSCTYQVTIESQNNAGSNDSNVGEEGVYQFSVDSAPPTPGPVGPAPCSCYTWSGASRNFSFAIRGTSYAVTATVTNSVANQTHSIDINIGCNEVQGNASGCFANTGFANLGIATYVP